MPTTVLAAFALLAAVQSAIAPESDLDRAVALLERTKAFAVGPVGIAGRMSDEEEALRLILSSKNPQRNFEKMVANENPATQLYGFLGLRWQDTKLFGNAAKGRRVSGKVDLCQGCIISEAEAHTIFTAIQKGEYDELKDGKEG